MTVVACTKGFWEGLRKVTPALAVWHQKATQHRNKITVTVSVFMVDMSRNNDKISLVILVKNILIVVVVHMHCVSSTYQFFSIPDLAWI